MNRRGFLRILGIGAAAIAAPFSLLGKSGSKPDLTTIFVDPVSRFAAGQPITIPRTGEVLTITAVDHENNTLTVAGRRPKVLDRSALVNDELAIIGGDQ